MGTKGWQKVLSFTLIQHIKSKSFIIGTIVMSAIICAFCVLGNILPLALAGDESGDTPGGTDSENPLAVFDAVYLFDETEILDESDLALIPIDFSDSESTLKDMVEELKTDEKSRMAVQISAQTSDGNLEGYVITSYYSEPCDTDSVDTLNTALKEAVYRRVLLNAGVAPEKYSDTQLYISSSMLQAGGQSSNFIQGAINYFVPVAISILLFMLIFSYGQIVAQSIATEKTSRVMELLLTSVRPLAVVIGKVLAMGIVSFAQFTLIGIIGTVSFAVSAPFGILGKALEIANNPEIQEALKQASENFSVQTQDMQIAEAVNAFTSTFTPINILIVVIIFLLGFLFYSLIAALVGASVSRMEDLQQAMQPFALLGVLGVYLAFFPVIFSAGALESGDTSANPVQMFSYFFPVSSPFALPSAVLLGTLSTVQAIVGVAVLAAMVVLIAVVVSKVYEAIILHNGNRIKFGEIIKMAIRK